ncbi:hypothetical protein [Salana multivorans]|uniref:hypothetical protein n=1 Tax=Salana multivorans TaxID=120377 RepID=UPI000B10A570|nr:hypothetical protein [Salana multivorans]
MRVPVDVWEDLAAEVIGTSRGDGLEVIAWRGSSPPLRLDVVSWAISSADRAIPDQLTLTVDDQDGLLTPWGLSDTLAPFGSRVSVAWVSGSTGLRVPWGVFRLRKADPRTQWLVAKDGIRRIHGGGQVRLTADSDPQCTADRCRLDADVPSSTSRLGEVRRLMNLIGMSVDVQGVADKPCPSGLVYDDGRLDAVRDHLVQLDAAQRMGPDGSLQIVPTVMDPVWTIEGGDEGALIGIETSLSDRDVYNGVTSRAEISSGGTRSQIVGRARISTGPLAWDGPFGPQPLFHQSAATSQAGAAADAEALLTSRQTQGEVEIDVECLFHPGIQIHDWVGVVAPTVGSDESLSGRVVGISASSISGGGATPSKHMSLVVAVPSDRLETIAHRVALHG